MKTKECNTIEEAITLFHENGGVNKGVYIHLVDDWECGKRIFVSDSLDYVDEYELRGDPEYTTTWSLIKCDYTMAKIKEIINFM